MSPIQRRGLRIRVLLAHFVCGFQFYFFKTMKNKINLDTHFVYKVCKKNYSDDKGAKVGKRSKSLPFVCISAIEVERNTRLWVSATQVERRISSRS